jgi:hypothetical protein
MASLEKSVGASNASYGSTAKAAAKSAWPAMYATGATAVRGARLAGAAATYYGKGAVNKMASAFNKLSGTANQTGRVG